MRLLLLILDGLNSVDTVASDPHHLLILVVLILDDDTSVRLFSVGFPYIERGAFVDAMRVLLALGNVLASLVNHELLLALVSCACHSARTCTSISMVGFFSILINDALQVIILLLGLLVVLW